VLPGGQPALLGGAAVWAHPRGATALADVRLALGAGVAQFDGPAPARWRPFAEVLAQQLTTDALVTLLAQLNFHPPAPAGPVVAAVFAALALAPRPGALPAAAFLLAQAPAQLSLALFGQIECAVGACDAAREWIVFAPELWARGDARAVLDAWLRDGFAAPGPFPAVLDRFLDAFRGDPPAPIDVRARGRGR
jgi:hypothetical protein